MESDCISGTVTRMKLIEYNFDKNLVFLLLWFVGIGCQMHWRLKLKDCDDFRY